jgi:predicted O-methyltransferase YrrM
MSEPSLLEIHQRKSGKMSDKWEAYFPVYERLLAPMRAERVTMLEIGVQNGGSLDVWGEYFPNAEHIVGCDINPRCDDLWYDDRRINVVVGNACMAETRDRITAYAPAFDIVIDDGSHVSSDIVQAFLIYFPLLKPGGVFVVEDTHAVYRAVPGGGVLSQTSAQQFFKGIAELTNLEHWKDQLHPQTLLSTFFPKPGSFPGWLLEGQVLGVEFLNSMVVIRKSTRPALLGQRIIVGDEATVFPGLLAHKTRGSA